MFDDFDFGYETEDERSYLTQDEAAELLGLGSDWERRSVFGTDDDWD